LFDHGYYNDKAAPRPHTEGKTRDGRCGHGCMGMWNAKGKAKCQDAQRDAAESRWSGREAGMQVADAAHRAGVHGECSTQADAAKSRRRSERKVGTRKRAESRWSGARLEWADAAKSRRSERKVEMKWARDASGRTR
jgi:hypothetical protein